MAAAATTASATTVNHHRSGQDLATLGPHGAQLSRRHTYVCLATRLVAQCLAPGVSLLLTRVFHCPIGLPRNTQVQRCNYQKFQGGNSRA